MFHFPGRVITQHLTEERSWLGLRFALAIMLVWFAAMNMTGPGAQLMERWLAGHLLLSAWAGKAKELAFVLGLVQVVAAGLLAGRGRFNNRWLGGLLALLISLFSLTLLATNPVWLDSLGGFPAIGAGQGLLKYVTIAGVALLLASEGLAARTSWSEERLRALGRGLMLAGLILVLAWIGAMKFTLPEARGIEPLLGSQPLFAWMPEMFGLRGASNVIGAVELLTAALLLSYGRSRRLFFLGAMLAALTFISTLSFMITLPAWDAAGFPFIGGSGHFLLKDLVLLAATLHLTAYVLARSGAPQSLSSRE